MVAVTLLTPISGDELATLCGAFPAGTEVSVVRTLDELALRSAQGDILVAIGTGVIVPAEVLERYARAYNFHAASPAFPGRDPHHFAIYSGASEYGATAHEMLARVDEGPIVGVESFPVPDGCTPLKLLSLANEAMHRLFQRLAPALVSQSPPKALADINWGKTKSTRRDFHEICNLPLTIDEKEFKRRFHAFDGAKHDNLTVTLHGWLFRIDKRAGCRSQANPRWADFTEEAYKEMLRLARDKGYLFSQYHERTAERHVLWRHDIDLSAHRALRMAEIEAEVGVASTFFVNPHSAFYNMLEPGILALLTRICELGHGLGLHFDADAHKGQLETFADLSRCLTRERDLLADWLNTEIRAFSFHNPDVANLLAFDQDEIAGMINTYGRSFRESYVYASDSNGYWRHKPIPVVINEGHSRLQILTHPEWWTPEPLPPRQRLERCAIGRARRQMSDNDAFLTAHNRLNLDK